jgi:colicin import membrane protein
MAHAREHLEFAPPPAPGMLRALLLAVLAHGLLLGVLTAGIAWKREATPVTVAAELWSALPQEAAAPASPDLPPDAPEEALPPIEPPPKPTPPTPAQVPQPLEPPKPDPRIALEKEEARKREEKQAQEEQRKLQLAQDKRDKEQREKAQREKVQRDKEQRAKEQREQARRDEAKQKAKELAERKKLEEMRQQNIQRMAGLAGAGGNGNNANSNALRASAPSASYVARVVARIKPNVVYTETVVGNPTTEIEIFTAADGSITSRKVVKSSGNADWDTAALNAIDKTAVLPRDENQRVPPSMLIVFSPRTLVGP